MGLGIKCSAYKCVIVGKTGLDPISHDPIKKRSQPNLFFGAGILLYGFWSPDKANVVLSHVVVVLIRLACEYGPVSSHRHEHRGALRGYVDFHSLRHTVR